jgi:DNA-binding LytR/AlgR family response regulator
MKIAICDDDEYYMTKFLGNILKATLETLHISAKIYFFTDGRQVIQSLLDNLMFDIVILDIKMHEINGKKLAARLRNIDSTFRLVFVSSFKKEVYTTLQYRVDSFIPKDAPNDFLIKELERVIRDCVGQNIQKHFFKIINESNTVIVKKIAVNDIFYMRCVSKTCYLYTGTKEYQLCEERFKYLEKTYSPLGFFEISRGYIINLTHVLEVDGENAILDNNTIIPISRRKKKLFLDTISKMIVFAVKDYEY